jgi:nicotinamidase-related amidase
VRPRCVASLPATQKFLAEARAHHVLVVYSYIFGGKFTDTLPAVAPKGKALSVQSGLDEFLHTDLENILKDHDIKTVIVTGTTAQGAVMHTGDEAALRGFNVVGRRRLGGERLLRALRGIQLHPRAAGRAQGAPDAFQHDQVLKLPTNATTLPKL